MANPCVDTRPAAIGDAEGIARLVSALGYPCTTGQMQERLAAMAEDGRHATFVATIDGNLAGMIGVSINRIYEEPGLVGRILALSVDCRCQGRGAGMSLIRVAEEWLKSQAISIVLVNSGFGRPDAHEFYEKAGYAPKGLSFRKKINH